MNFLKWYRMIVESGTEEPPESVWENIQDELDIDLVWNNLEAGLGEGKRRVLFSRIAAAASVLVVIGLGTLLYTVLQQDRHYPYSINDMTAMESVTNDAFRREPVIQAGLIPAAGFPGLILPEDRDMAVYPARISDQADSRQEPLLIPMNGRTFRLPVKQYEKELRRDEHLAQFPERDDLPEKRAGRFLFAGISGHAANTWLLNNKTLQGLKSDELTASLPSFGYDLSFIAGTEISKNLMLQADLFFLSRSSQKYNEYIHGQYVSNSLQLNYSGISLSGRWQFLASPGKGTHTLVFGAYTGLLRNAVQDLNGTTITMTEQYRSADYGIISGYEYLQPLNNKFTLGTGFQARYGLRNIFSGDDIIPHYLNSTRNASINLMLSIKYNLK